MQGCRKSALGWCGVIGKAHVLRPCGRVIEAFLSPARRPGAIESVLHKSPCAWLVFAGQWRTSADTKKKDGTQG
jgi:hypothetical protein